MSEIEKFVRGNDRLKRALSDPATRDRVETIREEMSQADREKRHALGGDPEAADLT